MKKPSIAFMSSPVSTYSKKQTLAGIRATRKRIAKARARALKLWKRAEKLRDEARELEARMEEHDDTADMEFENLAELKNWADYQGWKYPKAKGKRGKGYR